MENPTDQTAKATPRNGARAAKRAGAALLALVLLCALVAWFFAWCPWWRWNAPHPYANAFSIAGCVQHTFRPTVEEGGVTYVYNPDMVSILLLGVDKEEGVESAGMGGGQADTILLLSVNTRTQAVSLLPIPRDTVTNILHFDLLGNYALWAPGPICIAHGFGDGALTSGQLMEATVSNLMFGLPIQGFLSMDIDAISTVTDLVGGVPVAQMADFAPVTGKPPGETIVLDGELAELYVRARSLAGMDGTNLSRMVRQRQFLFAMMDIVKQKTKSNPLFPLQLYRHMKPYTTTNLSLRDLIYLGRIGLQSDGLELFVMEGELGENGVDMVMDEQAMWGYVRETYYLVDSR